MANAVCCLCCLALSQVHLALRRLAVDTACLTTCAAATCCTQGVKRTKLGLREFIRLGDFIQQIDTQRSLAVRWAVARAAFSTATSPPAACAVLYLTNAHFLARVRLNPFHTLQLLW